MLSFPIQKARVPVHLRRSNGIMQDIDFVGSEKPRCCYFSAFDASYHWAAGDAGVGIVAYGLGVTGVGFWRIRARLALGCCGGWLCGWWNVVWAFLERIEGSRCAVLSCFRP
jgi:hypothetical protein